MNTKSDTQAERKAGHAMTSCLSATALLPPFLALLALFLFEDLGPYLRRYGWPPRVRVGRAART